MTYISEKPSKRRKLPEKSSLGYDSQDDSGDDLFDDYETIATMPVANTAFPSSPSSSFQTLTQPTQIIDLSNARQSARSIVQVNGSPPMHARESNSQAKPQVGGILSNALAPAGTAFRPPAVATVSRKRSLVSIDDDDPGPVYHGGSSDDDISQVTRNNIKPSTFRRQDEKKPKMNFSSFIQQAQKICSEKTGIPMTDRVPSSSSASPDTHEKFHNILNNSFYQPDSSTRKLDGPSGYFASTRQRKPQTSGIPDRIPKNITLTDIQDVNLRHKVQRMTGILPNVSIATCLETLRAKHGSFDDSIEKIIIDTEPGTNSIDLTNSNNSTPNHLQSHLSVSTKSAAKQTVKAPARSIQAKWASTQRLAQSSQTKPPKSSPSSSPPHTPKPPRRRRLMRGRRPSPTPSTSPSPSPAQSLQSVKKTELTSNAKKQTAITSDYESDSSNDASEPTHSRIDDKTLTFLNECTVDTLMDFTSTSKEIAAKIVSEQPFDSLDEVRGIKMASAIKTTAKTKRKTATHPIGDRIVDKCLEMWVGYEAVDALVEKCSALGKPVAQEMEKWGVDVFGSRKGGEIEIVNFDNLTSLNTTMPDSGIGTPSSSTSQSNDEDALVKPMKKKRKSQAQVTFIDQPAIMGKNVELKDYQIVGINWLALLYRHNLSCILADEMGLGKTCQVVAFLAHLYEQGDRGCHLVIVPASTLENWLREFSVFCPTLVVQPYYGPLSDREHLREEINMNRDRINVVVTTYTLARQKLDFSFLRALNPSVCVFDEGHQLKNSKSLNYDRLVRLPARFRLLLTGTPLQNNLQELASLLGFILPAVFREKREDLECVFKQTVRVTEEGASMLLSAQRISRARSMLTPFVLRRKKHQVLKHLPAKTCRVEYCDLTPTQQKIYTAKQAKTLEVIAARATGRKGGKDTAHSMMTLRQTAIHPLLVRHLYTDAKLLQMTRACMKLADYQDANEEYVLEDLSVMTDFEIHKFWESKGYPSMAKFLLPPSVLQDSGKVTKLTELLLHYRDNGDRVLVFSQFRMVLDILEPILESMNLKFFRLDGNTRVDERQDMIDEFSADESITVFLLTTGAGGAGINLASANKVIIFDSSFNPQDDIQAENRAHRVGQTREVEVVRLVTRGTVEEQILELGRTKLVLDDRVAGNDGDNEEIGSKKAQEKGVKIVEQMILQQAKEKENKK